VLACAGLLLAQAVLADRSSAAEPVPAYIETALADPSRPDTDRQRDADRKPAEIIAFANIKPGDKVADFMPDGGYFTRIFCKVVGDAGHVYAIGVTPPATAPPPEHSPSASAPPQSAPAVPPVPDAPATPEPAGGQACHNITTSSLKSRLIPAPELHDDSDPGYVYEYWTSSPAAENFTAPEPLDVIWLAESYHDLHNKAFGSPDMSRVNTALLAALKPGGLLLIEDHAAVVRPGARHSASLHRIPAGDVTAPAAPVAVEQVRQEVTQAGFEFVGELHHSEDTRTANAHDVHHKADRFLLKFRKP
jgi:predicted methyltransferase